MSAAGQPRTQPSSSELRRGRAPSWRRPSPPTARHPLRALDARAMELASSDQELRAALFRFVDVVPACRSLDDLARHLTGFLDELPEAAAADLGRDADLAHAGRARRARRRRRGRRAAPRAPVHRRRDRRGRRSATLRRLWDARGRELGRPARRGDRHRGRGRPLRGALRGGARATSRRATAAWPARAVLEADAVGRAAARERVRQDLGADAAAAPRRARARPARRRRRDCGRCCAWPAERGAHLHIDMESLDSREAVLELVLDAARRGRVRDGPSAGLVLQAYLRDSPTQLAQILDWARAAPGAAAADRAARQGRLLGPRARPGAPARLAGAGVRGQARLRPQLRGADARRCWTRGRRVRRRDRLAQPALGRARDRLQPASQAARTGDLELQVLRGLGDELGDALAAARLPRPGLLPGRRPRRRHGLPRPPAAREHLATTRFLRRRRAARRSRSCWPRRRRD